MIEPFVIVKGELGPMYKGKYEEWREIVEWLDWWLDHDVPWEELPVDGRIIVSVEEPKGESVL